MVLGYVITLHCTTFAQGQIGHKSISHCSTMQTQHNATMACLQGTAKTFMVTWSSGGRAFMFIFQNKMVIFPSNMSKFISWWPPRSSLSKNNDFKYQFGSYTQRGSFFFVVFFSNLIGCWHGSADCGKLSISLLWKWKGMILIQGINNLWWISQIIKSF